MDFGSILIQVKKGDRAAEKALFEALADRMLFLCLRYVKSREDAEDLMISGMFKVFNNLIHFKEAHEHGFINWARRIMINECLMHLRKKNCLVLISEPVHEIPEEGIGVLEKLDAESLLDQILLLPAGYRTVFNLFVIEGLDHPEIADLLQISVGTSKSQLSKARQLLQRNIQKAGINYVRYKTI